MTTHKVFVYGSLLSGLHNHGVIGVPSSTLVEADALTAEKYCLKHLGGYPGILQLTEPTHQVLGELWLVDDYTLYALDRLEGNGSFYQRRWIELESGEQCWCYFLMDEARYASRKTVLNGDWRAEVEQKELNWR